MRPKRLAIGTKHLARTIYCFARQLCLLAFEVWAVFFFMKALSNRRIDTEHPWATGLDGTGEPIWPRNIVYRSPSKIPQTTEQSDAEIVSGIGRFLRSMVKRSAASPELPHGPKRRMPHAVNYIHGVVHYNGVFLLFDDFADLVSHLTDRRFRRDLLRFGRRHRREITLVFRTKRYDPLDYAYMVGCVRAHLPWFSNGNGPTKRPVLWGNASPHPAINLINGAWMGDLLRFALRRDAVRPPVDSRSHFSGDYFGRRGGFTFTDRLLAWYMYTDVRARGFRGQLFFTKRSRIEPHRVGEYREAGGYWRWSGCYDVPRPRFQGPPVHEPLTLPTVSVVIVALNEADQIGACIESVTAGLKPDELFVVDGGSIDDTAAVAERASATVLVDTLGGRGGQCRTGALAATGDVLVFLHADSRVGLGSQAAVEVAMGGGARIAMFRQRSESSLWRYRLLDRAARYDSILTRFGDQGIVVRRDFYDALGGMPNKRLFEDVHFLRKARRRGEIELLDADIVVSPRRFERNGLIRQLLTDGWLLSRYYLGASPARLYDRYHGEDRPCFVTS